MKCASNSARNLYTTPTCTTCTHAHIHVHSPACPLANAHALPVNTFGVCSYMTGPPRVLVHTRSPDGHGQSLDALARAQVIQRSWVLWHVLSAVCFMLASTPARRSYPPRSAPTALTSLATLTSPALDVCVCLFWDEVRHLRCVQVLSDAYT